jgi:hypothetical protein
MAICVGSLLCWISFHEEGAFGCVLLLRQKPGKFPILTPNQPSRKRASVDVGYVDFQQCTQLADRFSSVAVFRRQLLCTTKLRRK